MLDWIEVGKKEGKGFGMIHGVSTSHERRMMTQRVERAKGFFSRVKCGYLVGCSMFCLCMYFDMHVP